MRNVSFALALTALTACGTMPSEANDPGPGPGGDNCTLSFSGAATGQVACSVTALYSAQKNQTSILILGKASGDFSSANLVLDLQGDPKPGTYTLNQVVSGSGIFKNSKATWLLGNASSGFVSLTINESAPLAGTGSYQVRGGGTATALPTVAGNGSLIITASF